MAKAIEIQVCGGKICSSLKEACEEYLCCLKLGTDPEKINFTIELSDGTYKHVTFRETNEGLVVYGGFDGLPNILEWAKGKD